MNRHNDHIEFSIFEYSRKNNDHFTILLYWCDVYCERIDKNIEFFWCLTYEYDEITYRSKKKFFKKWKLVKNFFWHYCLCKNFNFFFSIFYSKNDLRRNRNEIFKCNKRFFFVVFNIVESKRNKYIAKSNHIWHSIFSKSKYFVNQRLWYSKWNMNKYCEITWSQIVCTKS